jgi:hypothetical protein
MQSTAVTTVVGGLATVVVVCFLVWNVLFTQRGSLYDFRENW